MIIANCTINRPLALNKSLESFFLDAKDVDAFSHMHYLIMKRTINIFSLSDYSLLTCTKNDKENKM